MQRPDVIQGFTIFFLNDKLIIILIKCALLFYRSALRFLLGNANYCQKLVTIILLSTYEKFTLFLQEIDYKTNKIRFPRNMWLSINI